MIVKRLLPLALVLITSACAPAFNRAARRGDVRQVGRMLDRGTSVNTKDIMNGSQTALHEAVANGHLDVVRLLLARGANVNAQSGNLTTDWGPPIYWLIRFARPCNEQRKVIARLLIEAGADLSLRAYGEPVNALFAEHAKRADACWKEIDSLVLDAPAVRVEAARAKARQAEQREAEARVESALPRIQAAEKEGDEARRNGRSEEALSRYASAAQLAPGATPEARRLREKIVTFAASLDPKPAVPEEANLHMLRGMAFSKRAENVDGLARAAKEMEQAIALAPWWAEAYFNLGLVQEKTGAIEDAIANMRLYLLGAPHASDAGAVKKKIIDLEVALELGQGAP
ncbi:MAG: ankyrin repeat domain-containing protein [Elusimicrobia bacterium]|nr:ankyrin repeat domain-containing protein [Elusimicrobiota bacterium]